MYEQARVLLREFWDAKYANGEISNEVYDAGLELIESNPDASSSDLPALE